MVNELNVHIAESPMLLPSTALSAPHASPTSSIRHGRTERITERFADIRNDLYPYPHSPGCSRRDAAASAASWSVRGTVGAHHRATSNVPLDVPKVSLPTEDALRAHNEMHITEAAAAAAAVLSRLPAPMMHSRPSASGSSSNSHGSLYNKIGASASTYREPPSGLQRGIAATPRTSEEPRQKSRGSNAALGSVPPVRCASREH